MNARKATSCVRASLLGALLFVSAGCSGPANSRTSGTLPEGPNTFAPVADMLGTHCGSLDCHGNPARSLRVYSWSGLRLAPNYPGEYDAQNNIVLTTDGEHQATYYSVLTLEPEILGQVLAQHGAHPERLTLVRKAHDTEYHKGHIAIKPGSDADKCLLSWLAGNVDQTACQKGSQPLMPPQGF